MHKSLIEIFRVLVPLVLFCVCFGTPDSLKELWARVSFYVWSVCGFIWFRVEYFVLVASGPLIMVAKVGIFFFSLKQMIWGIRYFWSYLHPHVVGSLDLDTPEVRGALKHDSNGPYLFAYVAGKPVMVRMEKGLSGASLESAMAGSNFTPVDAVPKGIVYFYIKSTKKIIGMGSRIKMGSKTYLLTAAHVLDDLTAYPEEDRFIGSGTTIIKMEAWSNFIYSGSSDFDLVCMDVPMTVWTTLGCSALSMGPTNRVNAVRLFGLRDGQWCMTMGKSRASSEEVFCLEHDASTDNAWSGTPIIANNVVVGVHQGSMVAANFGISLEILRKMESEREDRVWRQDPDLDEKGMTQRVMRWGPNLAIYEEISGTYKQHTSALPLKPGRVFDYSWDQEDEEDYDYLKTEFFKWKEESGKADIVEEPTEIPPIPFATKPIVSLPDVPEVTIKATKAKKGKRTRKPKENVQQQSGEQGFHRALKMRTILGKPAQSMSSSREDPFVQQRDFVSLSLKRNFSQMEMDDQSSDEDFVVDCVRRQVDLPDPSSPEPVMPFLNWNLISGRGPHLQTSAQLSKLTSLATEPDSLLDETMSSGLSKGQRARRNTQLRLQSAAARIVELEKEYRLLAEENARLRVMISRA